MNYMSLYKNTYVHFKSNEVVEKSGFKFTAKILSGKHSLSIHGRLLDILILLCISILECARNYTALQGRLYERKLSDCEQFISVPENYTITLYFTSLEIHMSGECTENNTPLKVSNYFE